MSATVKASANFDLSTSEGEILFPHHPDYETARQVYNRMHDKRPTAIVRPYSVAGVRTTLLHAVEQNCALALRGGGHHIAGYGTVEDGIVLDFCLWRSIRMLGSDTVEVQPGVTLGDLDRFLVPLGMVVPTGTVSETGLAGLALGGGIGWLVGLYGLTCDNLVGADVMLYDGQVVQAEDAAHADLLWALRGGGGNFGVVLAFRFRVHRLPTITAGSLVIRPSDSRASFADFLAIIDGCPDSLTLAASLKPLQQGVAELSIDYCLADDDPEPLDIVRRAFAAGLDREVSTQDFRVWQSHFDGAFQPPMRGYWKSAYSDTIPLESGEAIFEALHRSPGSNCAVTVEHLHGAYHRFGADHAAFGLRDCRIGFLASARWEARRFDDLHIDWARRTIGGLGFPNLRSYSNYSQGDGTAGSVMGKSSGRLAEVKRRYDPLNVFRLNPNIQPAIGE